MSTSETRAGEVTPAGKPSIPEVVDRFADYLDANPSWGSLHIVLEDGNVSDGDVKFCIEHAAEEGDTVGQQLAEVLLRMSRTQRHRLSHAAYEALQARFAASTSVPTVVGDLQGPPRHGLTAEEAKDVLERYPDGTIGHDGMDRDSFVAVDRNGVALFYHGVQDSITRWNWATDPQEFADGPRGWAYNPGSEMSLTAGGPDWWKGIRDGELTPVGQEAIGFSR